MAKRRRQRAANDPWSLATYPEPEAAWALNLPASTLRSWIHGRSYPAHNETQNWEPLISPAGRDAQGVLLSFLNLVELHILRALREADVSVGSIRKAIQWLSTESPDNQHPLIRKDLHTYGNGIFIKKLGEIVEISYGGQHAIKQAVEQHLLKIEWENHLPIRLYPYSASGSVSFEIDPKVGFGQLRLTGTRIPVAVLLERYEAGESYKSLADDYGQSKKTIEAAIRSFDSAA